MNSWAIKQLSRHINYNPHPLSQELVELRREASSTTRSKIRRKEAAEEFAMQLSEALSKARLHFEEEKKSLSEQLSDVHLKVRTR